jgi:hypothetical protein
MLNMIGPYNFNLYFDSPSIEVVALYLNAQRLAPMISDLLMVGLRFEGRINGHNQLSEIEIAGLVLNNSVFVELHKNTKIGIGTCKNWH